MKTWEELTEECADLVDNLRKEKRTLRHLGAAKPRRRGKLTNEQLFALLADDRDYKAVAETYGVQPKHVLKLRQCAREARKQSRQ